MKRKGKCWWMVERNKKHRTFKEKIKITCLVCSKNIEVKPSRKDAKYCCKKCRDISQIIKSSASYNRKVYTKLSKLFLQKCVLCGVKENLLVHHIDGNTFNNSLKNLSILCKGCHNKVHQRMSGKLLIISTPSKLKKEL